MIEDLIRQVNRLQQQVDGLIKPEVGRWIDWTPTVKQSGAVTVTITEAKYNVTQSDVRIYCRLTVTGSGTAANQIRVSGFPAAIRPVPGPAPWPLGVGIVLDTGTGNYYGTPIVATATEIAIVYSITGGIIGVSPNFALANGDFIYLNMYWKI